MSKTYSCGLTAHFTPAIHAKYNLPVKVFFTVELVFSRVALLRQGTRTVVADDTLSVPGTVKDV